MTGAIAYRVWESAAEPARIESAKVRVHEPGAAARFAGMVEILRPLRFALVQAVTREEAGKLAEICSEFQAMSRLAEQALDDGLPLRATVPCCPRCRMPLVPGRALLQTFVGSEDFGGDAGAPGSTMGPGGPGALAPCLKCPSCGHSQR